MNRKLIIYGGLGVVVLAGGYYVLSHRSAAAQQDASSNTGDSLGGYQYPIVYGSGGSSLAPDAATGGGSTDNMISQLLATQLATQTADNKLAEDKLASNERLTLAGYGSNKDIATINANSAIEQSLASQLGALAGSFGWSGEKGEHRGPDAIFGSLGYANGKISVDLAASIPGINKKFVGKSGATSVPQLQGLNNAPTSGSGGVGSSLLNPLT